MSSLIKEDFVNTHTKNAVYVSSGGAILCILISLFLIINKISPYLFIRGIGIFSIILLISGFVYWGQLVFSNKDTKKKIKKSETAGFIAGGILGGIAGIIVFLALLN
jgi:hypothetical protein